MANYKVNYLELIERLINFFEFEAGASEYRSLRPMAQNVVAVLRAYEQELSQTDAKNSTVGI
ncbi:hypothetical protein KY309_02295 [Candidatus Woesearchaeota archaeon]|nr:hypothetical protein [Candidatus Woesearchaeota archaeon]MBW3016417.1 hypothetical protein [Candidatus Woesearchaeota archaeon]